MRWCRAFMKMLLLTVMTACPTEFGTDGRVNKAVHKDAVELLLEECEPATFDEWCSGDRQYTPECIEKCGG